MADRDLPRLAALLVEAEGPLAAVVAEMFEPEPGDGAGSGRREEHDADDSAIAQPDPIAGADGGDQPLDLVQGDFRCLALDDLVAFAAYTGRGVEHHEVTCDQEVKEATECRQVKFPGGSTAGVLVEVDADQRGRNLGQRDVLVLSFQPMKKPADGMQIGSPRVRIADMGRKGGDHSGP